MIGILADNSEDLVKCLQGLLKQEANFALLPARSTDF